MARGVSTVGATEAEAIASVQDGNLDIQVISCQEIDPSDIELSPTTPKKRHWVVVIEDADPSQFIQDADPVAKAAAYDRHFWDTLAADPERLSVATIEGPFRCPSCAAEINLEIPPTRVLRRIPRGQKIYSRCPECRTKLFRLRGGPLDDWRVDDRPSPAKRPAAPRPPGEGLGVRRACIFCAAEDQKISKEHLWPKWMRKHVEGSSGGRSSRIRSRNAVKIVNRQDIPLNGFDREVSGPCKRCNETWMGQLEEQVAPLLTPMLNNEEVTLRPLEQQAIARWATLKMLVAQEMHGETAPVVPLERFRQFFIDRRLPIGGQVWLGRYSGGGPWPTSYRFQSLYLTLNGEDGPGHPNAYLLGFSIGHLAVVYWGHEIVNGPTPDIAPISEYLIPIWPATGQVQWPPPALMEADGLDFVLDQFPTSGWI